MKRHGHPLAVGVVGKTHDAAFYVLLPLSKPAQLLAMFQVSQMRWENKESLNQGYRQRGQITIDNWRVTWASSPLRKNQGANATMVVSTANITGLR